MQPLVNTLVIYCTIFFAIFLFLAYSDSFLAPMNLLDHCGIDVVGPILHDFAVKLPNSSLLCSSAPLLHRHRRAAGHREGWNF